MKVGRDCRICAGEGKAHAPIPTVSCPYLLDAFHEYKSSGLNSPHVQLSKSSFRKPRTNSYARSFEAKIKGCPLIFASKERAYEFVRGLRKEDLDSCTWRAF